MSLEAVFFYLFAIVAVMAALSVITVRNPVHAVLFLILTFFNAAGLFILLKAEFLAMLLVIVYVGAVAVLFLFVVMMLDVDFAELRAGFIKNAPLGALIGGVVLVELIMVLGMKAVGTVSSANTALPIPTDQTNTDALGRVIYTDYIFLFQGAGLILLVAMIGAIVLTLHHRDDVRRQSIAAQVARQPKDAMEVVKVASGQAIVPSNEEQS